MSNFSIKQKILTSIKPVVKNNSSVWIDDSKVLLLAKKLKNHPVPGWDNVSQFLGNPEETIHYYFFLDSINFCFWNISGGKRWEFKKDGRWMHGYYALSYALKEALLADKRLFDASYLSEIAFADFSRIFKGKGELLLLGERHKIIKENFKIIREKYNGKALNLVIKAGKDANKLVKLIIRDFPTFRDCTEFEKKKIYFLKRAQLFVSDINYAFQGKDYGYFKNMEDLTIFADYKLPQLLESEGVLIYSDKLEDKIRECQLIKRDSGEEIEIRANTIWACEKILQELMNLGRKLTSNNLDWMLWVMSQEKVLSLPYHRTITINY
jgi:hypothetical protein